MVVHCFVMPDKQDKESQDQEEENDRHTAQDPHPDFCTMSPYRLSSDLTDILLHQETQLVPEPMSNRLDVRLKPEWDAPSVLLFHDTRSVSVGTSRVGEGVIQVHDMT